MTSMAAATSDLLALSPLPPAHNGHDATCNKIKNVYIKHKYIIIYITHIMPVI